SSDQARTRLARASAAWRHGGLPALGALDAAHPPDRASERTAREKLAGVRIRGRSGPPLVRRTGGRLRLAGEDV
ncbi:SWF or SNF family helicase, partial [Streptomyces sp. TRM76130]|nr:SWF or SNF family helicase [Streptomyces sp. TRM76130]